MNGIACTWWEYTDRMTEFVDGVSTPIMRRLDTGEERSMADLPAGALFAAPREIDSPPHAWPPAGADGKSIVCLVPGDRRYPHHWHIDSRSANCTMKNDNVHRCWVRHGTVGQALTVDKAGNTCQAGAGSILVPGWHGFLTNGHLVPA